MSVDLDSISKVTAFGAQALLVQWMLGTLLVLAVGLLLKGARSLNAATRHAVWVAVLLVTAALPLMTLVTAEAGAGQVGDALLAKAGKVDPPAFVATEPTVGVSVGSQESPHSGPPMFRRIQGTVTGFACFVWLVLALRNLILLAGAANNLPALRKSSLPADHRDGELLSNLAAQAATNGVPDLRRLPEAKSPAAIGCLAPWIAVPASWPSELSLTAQKHVLLHELAHVVRRDGLIELVCRFAEALLPLHPAMTWLREQIDVERESACDDWAAAHAGISPSRYAHSILDCASQSLPHHNTLALAFGHRASQLRKRVQNIMSSNRNHRAELRRIPLAASLLLLAFGTLASASAWPPVPTLELQGTLGFAGTSAGTLEVDTRSADDSAMFRAMDRGAWQDVSEMIDEGREVNQVWPGDGSPLIVAARSGRIDIARQLLERGAEVDLAVDGDGSPLIQAAGRGDLEMAELFLSYGADIDAHHRGGDGNPLIEASKSGQREMADYLLQRGAAINIHIAGDDTPLINAVQQGHGSVVRFLLDNGADPNLEGDLDRPGGIVRTPLNQATTAGEDTIESMLRSAGATN